MDTLILSMTILFLAMHGALRLGDQPTDMDGQIMGGVIAEAIGVDSGQVTIKAGTKDIGPHQGLAIFIVLLLDKEADTAMIFSGSNATMGVKAPSIAIK